MALNYGIAGAMGISPHNYVLNFVVNYVGLGPGGIARAERDSAALAAAYNNPAKAAMRAYTTMGIVVGLATGAVILHTTKAGVAFQAFQQQLRANSSFIGREFDTMTVWAENWSRRTGDAVENVMGAFRRATDIGFHGRIAQALVATGSQLALGAGAKTPDVTASIGALARAEGLHFRTRQQAAAAFQLLGTQLHTTAQLGFGTTVASMTPILPRLMPYLALAGPGGVTEGMAMLAAMTRSGQTLPTAATGIQQLVRTIELPRRPTTNAIQTLFERSGIKVGDLFGLNKQGLRAHGGVLGVIDELQRRGLTKTEIADLFPNVRAQVPALLLGSTMRGSARDIEGILRNPRTMAQRGVQTPLQSFRAYERTDAAALKRMTADAHLASIAIGTQFAGALGKVLAPLAAFTDHMARLLIQYPAFAKFVAVLLGMGTALGALSLGIRAVTFMTAPLGGMFSALAYGFGGLVYEIKFLAAFKWEGLALQLMEVRKAILATSIATKIFSSSLLWPVTAALILIPVLIAIYKHCTPLREAMHAVGMAARALGNAIYNFLPGPLKAVANMFGSFARTIVNLFSWIYQQLLGQSIIPDIVNGIKTWIMILPNFFSGVWDAITTTVVNWGKTILGAMKTAINTVINWIKGNWQTLLFGAIGGPLGLLVKFVWDRLPATWKAKAQAAIGGFIAGIASEAHKVWSMGLKVAENLIGGIKHFFGAHNPAEWMANFIKDHWPSWLPNPFGGGSSGGTGQVAGPYTSGSTYGSGFSLTNNAANAGSTAMLNSMLRGKTGGVMDTDFAAKAGTPYALPKGGSYKLIKNYMDPDIGGVEIWQNTNNGQRLMFLHGQPVTGKGANARPSQYNVGQTVVGGTFVGKSGHPLTSRYSDPTFYHLCVVSDSGEQVWLSNTEMAQIASKPSTNNLITRLGGGGFAGIVAKASAASGIAPNIVASQIYQESRFKPNARSWNPNQKVWDVGFLQYGPSEAAAVHGYYGYDPTKNAVTGERYLAYLLHGAAHGDMRTALAMYNGGPGRPNYAYADAVLGRAGNTAPTTARYSRSGTQMPGRSGSGGVPGIPGHVSTRAGHLAPGTQIPRTEQLPAAAQPHYVREPGTSNFVSMIPYDVNGKTMWVAPWDVGGQWRINRKTGQPEMATRVVLPNGKVAYYYPTDHPKPGQQIYRGAVRLTYRAAVTTQTPQGPVTTPAGYYQAGAQLMVSPSGVQELRIPATPGHPGGLEILPGQTRYNTRGGYMEVRVGGGPGTTGVWLPVPGSREVMPNGAIRVWHKPSSEHPGGWVNLGTPYQQWRRAAQARSRVVGQAITVRQADIQELQGVYPTTPNVNMTPREAQAWMTGRARILREQEQNTLARYQQQYIMGNLSAPRYHQLQQIETKRLNDNLQKLSQKFGDWQLGGGATGVYRAYHIVRRDQCAAEEQANAIRKEQHKEAKVASQHLRSADTHLRNILHEIQQQGRNQHRAINPPKTAKPHAPPGHPAATTHFDDPRFIGHPTAPRPN